MISNVAEVSGRSIEYERSLRKAHLVEGAVLVVLGEGVLLQEVVLEEARRLQNDFVVFRKRVLSHMHMINRFEN